MPVSFCLTTLRIFIWLQKKIRTIPCLRGMFNFNNVEFISLETLPKYSRDYANPADNEFRPLSSSRMSTSEWPRFTPISSLRGATALSSNIDQHPAAHTLTEAQVKRRRLLRHISNYNFEHCPVHDPHEYRFIRIRVRIQW